MGKFIVIKEEDWGILSRQVLVLPESTELSTDESIEERAKEILSKHSNCDIGVIDIFEHDGNQVIEAMKELATEQSLIEQMKAKEFAEWCQANEFYYYKHEKKWAHISFPNAISKHCNVWYTTEQLFNQFTNQKQ